jgi:hypothetical protein
MSNTFLRRLRFSGKAVITRRHLSQLFHRLGLEVDEGIVFDGITDLERIAAHLTVFDVGVTVDGEVQDHRNFRAAIRTGEGVFHDASTFPQVTR